MKFCSPSLLLCFIGLSFLQGCSLFKDSGKTTDSNVAHFVAPEVAADGASARKKPIKPKSYEGVSPEYGTPEVDACLEKRHTIYTVQKGDTIYGLARKFKTAPAAIMKANGLEKDSKLFVGQRLKIEECGNANVAVSVGGGKNIVYVVEPGDSLSKIAREFGVSLQALKDANSFTSDKLLVGQKINIPGDGARPSEAVSTRKAASYGEVDSDGQYVVARGDSLYIIAKRFGVKQSELMEANNISNPDKLRVGQKLAIPNRNPAVAAQKDAANKPLDLVKRYDSSDLYTIRAGDTLDSIASKLNVARNDLADLNSVSSSDELVEGKKLLIPQKKIQKIPESSSTSKSVPIEGDFFDNFEDIPVVEISN